MFRIKIKDAVNDEISILPIEYAGSRIYVIRDGETIFYVGQSVDPVYRIQQHLGYERQPASRIGRLILANEPESDEWIVECYQLEDCRPIFEKHVEFPDEQLRKFLVNFACTDVQRAESYMINALHPCLNSTFNKKPNPLPTKYIK